MIIALISSKNPVGKNRRWIRWHNADREGRSGLRKSTSVGSWTKFIERNKWIKRMLFAKNWKSLPWVIIFHMQHVKEWHSFCQLKRLKECRCSGPKKLETASEICLSILMPTIAKPPCSLFREDKYLIMAVWRHRSCSTSNCQQMRCQFSKGHTLNIPVLWFVKAVLSNVANKAISGLSLLGVWKNEPHLLP